jgi:hypothetical protein
LTTSGLTTFSINRNQLIAGSLRLVGVVASGETPTPDQYTEGAEALNMMVKAWEADGMPLWAIKQYQVPLSASATFSIGVGQTINTPKPLKVIQAFLSNSAGTPDIPMRVLTRDEYNRLGNKTSTGQPIQVFYEPLNDYGVLHVFPIPDATSIANNTITIVYQRPFEDFVASTDTPDFPQEWYEAIKYGLSVRMAGENTLSLQIRQTLSAEAQAFKDAALGFGTEEGSMYLQADLRNW